MNCKACGEPIPSHLLRQESFQCPSCGRVYRRSGKSSGGSEPAERRPARREKPTRSGGGSAKWLLTAVVAVLILALVFGGVWLLGRRGSGAPRVSGSFRLEGLAAKKTATTAVEIPSQGGTDYMIVTETSESGVICSIKDKTPTSFSLVGRNVDNKDHNPTISWALLPCKPSN